MKRGGFLKRKTPLRKKSKTSAKKLKDELWKLCREITAKRFPNASCYTCGNGPLEGSNKHLGHYITSSVCSAEMRYDLDNLRFQCYACNIHKSGNWIAFQEHLARDGYDVDELIARNNKTKGMQADVLWYQRKIADYQLIASR